MDIETMKAKVETMERDISEIKQDLKTLPDQVANKINENVDMKIRLAISETEKKYQGKFIGMLLAIIGEAAGLIISFVMK
jgi:regulator of replication initiation timing